MRKDGVRPILDGQGSTVDVPVIRRRRVGVSREEHISLCQRVLHLLAQGYHHSEITKMTGVSRRMVYYYQYEKKIDPRPMSLSNKTWTPEQKWHAGRQADAFFGLLDQYNKLLEEHNKLKEEHVRVCNSPQRGKPAGVVEPSAKAQTG